MDIQRGDTVYYRGEVWEVFYRTPAHYDDPELYLRHTDPDGVTNVAVVGVDLVQRVEQVR